MAQSIKSLTLDFLKRQKERLLFGYLNLVFFSFFFWILVFLLGSVADLGSENAVSLFSAPSKCVFYAEM